MITIRGYGVVGSLCILASIAGVAESQQSAFTEEAVSRGIDVFVTNSIEQFGCGVALVDLDNDGDCDAIITGGPGGQVRLYENDGTGQFTDRSAGSGIPNITKASGITAADYDDDGDLDLYFSNHLEPDQLMQNTGSFTFSDVTLAAGLGSNGAGMGACWGDINGDGYLDLYVPMRTGVFGSTVRNAFYQNNGDGTFTENALLLGIQAVDDPGLVSTFFDYDRDGDADLYLGNDKGSGPSYTNHLYENVGGTFIDVTAASGTEANVDCMGIGVGDWDHNGFQDLYVTNTPPGNVLLLNNGNGTFTDSSVISGTQSFMIGWAAMLFDYDNDMHQDLYVCQMMAPDRLYEYNGAWPALDVAPAMGVADMANSFCVAAGDIDNDGDLDMVMQSNGQNIKLYINNEGQKRHWVKLEIAGIGANRFGIGTNVDLLAGGLWQMREVFAGNNYKSQNERILHFGLDTQTTITQMDITWPGGTITRSLTGYSADQTWTIYPPNRLGDVNNNGKIDPADFAAAMACMRNQTFLPGCEIFDLDGDGDVDTNDLVAMGLNLIVPPPSKGQIRGTINRTP